MPAMDSVIKFTDIKNPVSIAYLDNNRLAVAGDGCIIFNFIDNKGKRINKHKIFNVTVNKDHTRFALLGEKNLTVYSALTGKKLAKKKA